MPQQVALLTCVLFILSVFIIDVKRKPKVSIALWIPLIWLMIISSRYASLWLNLGAPIGQEVTGAYYEGSPVDRNVFLVLIIAGIIILSKRQIEWSKIVQKNPWIFLLFLYSGISILWSDYPFVSLKRWIKSVGDVLMVLIILTDLAPVEAIKAVVRRCAYVLIPLSGLFILYYPDLGRQYTYWTYELMYTGVTLNKNSLGRLCTVCGLCFFWSLLSMWREKSSSFNKKELLIPVLFLMMTFWVLRMSDSATSLLCLIVGICILTWLGLPVIKGNIKLVGIYLLITVVAFFSLQYVLELNQILISTLGRDTTLTGRTELWTELYGMNPNPMIGAGYEGFWLGDRLEALWERHELHPNQAHNGYLEIYLNLGLIGIFLLVGIMVNVYKKSINCLIYKFDYGRFRLSFLVIFLIYNVTEAAIKHLHLMWFVFLLVAIDVPSSTKVSDRMRKQHTVR